MKYLLALLFIMFAYFNGLKYPKALESIHKAIGFILEEPKTEPVYTAVITVTEYPQPLEYGL